MTLEQTILEPIQSTCLARQVLIEGTIVDIPDGWMLAKGMTRLGDRFLNTALFRRGIIQWESVTSWHVRRTREDGTTNYYVYATAFNCLIRKKPE